MRASLGGSQIPVTNLEHVRVVMGVKVDSVHLERVHVEDVRDRSPAGVDVAAHAPADCSVFAPREDVGSSPDAKVVEDFAILLG